MLPLCRHILHSGLICQQAAVNGTYYCRHHQVVRATLAQMDPKPETYGIYMPLPLVFPEDRAAIQTNAMVVMQALNDRKIDVRTANAYRGLLRLCEANLSHGPLVESGKDVPGGNVVHAVILTPQGEEIAIPREVLEEGEAEPVHGKECPCGVCDEEYRGAPIERHHVRCKCGMCEEEDLPSGQPRSAQETTQLSSRPGSESADAVAGPAVSQPSHQAGDPASPVVDQAGCDQGLELRAEIGEESVGDVARAARGRRMRPAGVAKRKDTFVDPVCGEQMRAHEAEQAEIARKAREAGLEPPPYKPWNIAMFKSEGVRRYEEYREQVRKNQQAAREMWIRRYPNIPPDEPCLSWGEEHDKKLAAMREAGVAGSQLSVASRQ